jgi:hypothetical protein
MGRKLALTLAVVTLLAAARAQEPRQDDQQVIDDFVNTRGLVFEERPVRRPAPKPSGKGGGGQGKTAQGKPRPKAGKAGGGQGDSAAAAKPKAKQGAGGDAAAGEGDAATLKASVAGRPIALGYTLYKMEGARLVPTAAREFTSSDRIRIFLETNTDGYVYVFNTTDEAEPTMIYPHVTVGRGANGIEAHRRDFIPTTTSFEFDAKPGVERVYVVVTRAPLDGVPSGEQLVRRCGGVRADCYWQPTAAEWSGLKQTFERGGRVREGRLPQLAGLQAVEPATLTRGLRVQQEEPPPAVVRVSESPAAPLLVTTIDLVHR